MDCDVDWAGWMVPSQAVSVCAKDIQPGWRSWHISSTLGYHPLGTKNLLGKREIRNCDPPALKTLVSVPCPKERRSGGIESICLSWTGSIVRQ